jgi:hypothetical protein
MSDDADKQAHDVMPPSADETAQLSDDEMREIFENCFQKLTPDATKDVDNNVIQTLSRQEVMASRGGQPVHALEQFADEAGGGAKLSGWRSVP